THLETQDRNDAGPWMYIPGEDIATYADHHALLVSTVIPVENIDARQVSNSLRVMTRDSNIEQMVPVGDSNAVYLHGRASDVAMRANIIRRGDARGRLVVPEKVEASEADGKAAK
ncbi:MAG: hypothetical protein GY722_01360, partial [bacterium]|nr:hypothetical protein [bacterium]